ncbi:hypothetical protein BH23ACI1_BH23ACI1_16910 [soil metagenome]
MNSAPDSIRREGLRDRLAYHAPALLFFAVLTFLLAFPVVAALFSSRIPGWEGDNLYYVRSMWWWKRALLDLGISPFVDVTAYYPVGHQIAYSEMTPTNTLLFLPVTALFGPEISYNVVLLFSFVATGFATYLWVHYLTGSRSAGLLAGTIVGFLPFRFAHLPGHLPQMTMQWIPLALYAFERFLDRPRNRAAAWLGVWVAFTIVGCWYYGYALALIFPVYAVARTAGDWSVWRSRDWWQGILVSGMVAGVIVAPFLYQMLTLSSEGRLERSLAEMQSWALNWYDLFIPNLIHPLWGETASLWFPKQRALWPEKVHALGYAAMGSAIVGLIGWRARRKPVLLALMAVWVVSYLIALGPFLNSGDEMVRLPLPAAAARLAANVAGAGEGSEAHESFLADGVPVPLPSALLHKFVPFTSGMRVMARFSIWTALATAALAGFGLVTLMAWADRRWGPAARGALAASIIACAAFESISHIPTMPVGPRTVDVWLADQPDEVVIVELPVDQATRGLQNYWSTRHRRNSLFGWSGDSFPPPVLVERLAALNDFPSRSSVEFLRASRATHLLLTPSQIPDWDTMQRLVGAEPALDYVQTFGDVQVYRILRH